MQYTLLCRLHKIHIVTIHCYYIFLIAVNFFQNSCQVFPENLVSTVNSVFPCLCVFVSNLTNFPGERQAQTNHYFLQEISAVLSETLG